MFKKDKLSICSREIYQKRNVFIQNCSKYVVTCIDMFMCLYEYAYMCMYI